MFKIKANGKKVVALSLLLTAALYTSCNNNVTGPKHEAMKFFEDNPTTINWDKKSSDIVESFSANVKVFVSDKKSGGVQYIADEYKVSSKTINGILYSRIDLSATSDGVYRSIISNDKEMILFNAKSGEISARLPLDNSNISSDLATITSQTSFSRINIKSVKEAAKRLSFDMSEEEKNQLEISIPSSLFSTEKAERISTKILYDTNQETLNSLEIVDYTCDGDTITTSYYPVYEEKNGEPVKIGTISIVDTKKGALIEGLEGMEYFNSMDDIPEIPADEFDKMVATGTAVVNENMQFGNPADLSNTVTTIEKYEDIEINSIDDSLFKILLEVK